MLAHVDIRERGAGQHNVRHGAVFLQDLAEWARCNGEPTCIASSLAVAHRNLHVRQVDAQCIIGSTTSPMSSSSVNSPDTMPPERLRIGECEVDVPLREITRTDGSKTRVTAKSMAVLILLVERAGQVVTRETLLESVWAGTMPTDDVVTQAITGLRKAFADDRDAPRYLETIPKSGYRLLATVSWPSPPAEAVALPTQPVSDASTGKPAQWGLPITWMLAAVSLAALAWWWVHDMRATKQEDEGGGHSRSDLPYTLLTSRIGPESQPALSPDGALVAFVMPPDIADGAPAVFVQAVASASPRQLTTPPPGYSDHLPRWSPDARQLMFTRIDHVGGCVLHLMPASGGATRAVGPCNRINGRYDWLPDGSGIIAGLKAQKSQSAPLSILRLDDGQWQAMAYPIGQSDVDFDPRFSPDGTRLAFRRNLSHSDVWVMPAAGGEPRRLTHLRGSISGWDWAQDGQALLLGLLGSPPQLYRHDIESGKSTALGRFPASGLDVAVRRGVMTFSIDEARIEMFRYPMPLRANARPEGLFASTGNDLLPSPSPDGRWLAFYSDRSREARLWLADMGSDGDLRMVEGITPIWRHPPQWSMDGKRLLVVSQHADTAGQNHASLHEVDVASGRTKILPVTGSPNAAQYLPGQRLLLLGDAGDGQLSLRVLDAAASPMRVLAERAGVGEARFDPVSQRIHFVSTHGPGLWQTGLDLASPVRVDAEQPGAYWLRRWGVFEGKAFGLRTAAPECLANWYWLGREPASAAGCLDRERRGVPALAPVVSADGRWLYMSMVAGQENSDIGLLELDALPPSASASN